METAVTRSSNSNASEPVLHMALELAEKNWKLALTTGLGQKPRIRQVHGGDIRAVLEEVAKAKHRFRLPEETKVVSCYEAGMEGFWVHRALVAAGIENHVVVACSVYTALLLLRRGQLRLGSRVQHAAIESRMFRLSASTRGWNTQSRP